MAENQTSDVSVWKSQAIRSFVHHHCVASQAAKTELSHR